MTYPWSKRLTQRDDCAKVLCESESANPHSHNTGTPDPLTLLSAPPTHQPDQVHPEQTPSLHTRTLHTHQQ